MPTDEKQKYMSIGQSTAQALKDGAKQKGRSLALECALVDIPESSFRDWQKGKHDPSAYYLQQMALAGYDVNQILIRATVEE